uniref:Uncharacterized protein n=1 Tax=Sarcophilus harrisii TaxID=9305 RepID=A0A7N4NR07_SARHA
MYKKEILLKNFIVEELTHVIMTVQDPILSFLSMWLYQPCVENTWILMRESFILQTALFVEEKTNLREDLHEFM